ncbi:hypothetical protein QM467_17095 [Rhodoblastus sp. 17X3]|uniref:hypothetical protein n=1 Tax=Rhodoblastus sp. 17X3 TaxID=3047026 RepID=UPI0024B6A9C2|nr:hypothetical protein [Rhodoblastus sp. 17X3]MDI9849764.1 hypothetical protein [Rhodoblastus sp. 17X3]
MPYSPREFCISLLAMAAIASPGHCQESIAKSFGSGADQGSVGLSADAGDDAELEGPQAIYAGDSGEIYLLDQLNGRVLKFDPAKPDDKPQSLELPEGLAPTDLIVSDSDIHVWDGKVVTLQATGREDAPVRGLSITRSAEPPDEAITSTFAQMGSTDLADAPDPASGAPRSLQSTDRNKQVIASHGRGPVVASFSALGGESGVKIEVAPRKAGESLGRLELQVRDRLGAVELLDIDRRGRFFVFAENIPTVGSDAPNVFVARFSPAGRIEGVYELPLTQNVGLSRRFVAISPDGDVYFLRNKKGSSDVLGVGFRQISKGKIIDLGGGSAGFDLNDVPKIKAAHAGVRPLTREQVIQTGMEFANVRWRVNPSSYGNDPDTSCSGFNRIRRPGYLHGKVNQQVVGVPYCWGCHGSLANFASSIGRGRLAGNVCTRNDPRPDVAGVDCSAFVSAAWGLSTHFTTIAIPAITRQLPSGWDMLPGDALNKPGSHVMLFVRFTPDKKAEVLESSTGGCNGKVCRNVYPLGSLLARGYAPVRYRGLMADTSAATDASKLDAATPQGKTKGR